MNKRNYILLFFSLFFLNVLSAQTIVEPSPIKWLTIEQADSLFDKNPKPILIDVYTDWCGWCKYMMKTTFANKSIASYINTNFYPVRFNAETFDTVTYRGKIYINPGVGVKSKHDFAKFLLNGRFSFPTIVYIDRKRNLYQIPGYLEIKDIEPLLVYFSEDITVNASYDDWKILYEYTYPKVYKEDIAKIDTLNYPDTSGIVQAETLKDASELTLKNKKPLLIYFYTDWCQSCKVIDGIVLKNKVIANLINKHFNFVRFNAASQNINVLFGDILKSTGKGRPHQLTYALLKQSLKFPAFVFISSKKVKLNEMHGFILPYQLEEVLSYFSEEKYKTQTFVQFIKSFKGEIKH
ncbi:MAG: thioredoxin family protein [Chlorobi bacterium]|nr:thioredoxin family protein [Chlorobiota bacterium]